VSRLARITLLLISVCIVGACGTTRCDAPARYSDARELPPVQVPDDLTPPDESRSLRIPQVSTAEPRKVTRKGDCLESPPDYFEGGQPQ
jgi:uncharacterized lipoprotein